MTSRRFYGTATANGSSHRQETGSHTLTWMLYGTGPTKIRVERRNLTGFDFSMQILSFKPKQDVVVLTPEKMASDWI